MAFPTFSLCFGGHKDREFLTNPRTRPVTSLNVFELDEEALEVDRSISIEGDEGVVAGRGDDGRQGVGA